MDGTATKFDLIWKPLSSDIGDPGVKVRRKGTKIEYYVESGLEGREQL